MKKFLIDVSEHNGTINWEEVKKHIDGAIIRCGYGMDQTNQDDKQWARNAAECERLGIPYGVYLYSYATNAEKAKSEAQHVLRLIKGRKLSYPVYFDMEEKGTESVAVENAKIFGDMIEEAGYWCGVYYNKDWNNRVVKGQLDRFTLWGASYGSNNGQVQENYKPNFGEDIWQYSSTGKVPGISGNVDVNVCYRDFPAEISGTVQPTPQPEPPEPTPTPKPNTIAEDGIWGVKTTKKAQAVFGTGSDGIISNQLSCYQNNCKGIVGTIEWNNTKRGGSLLVKALQRHVGVTADGYFGPGTIKAIQRRLGCGADGVLSYPSPTIKAFQKWLNQQ